MYRPKSCKTSEFPSACRRNDSRTRQSLPRTVQSSSFPFGREWNAQKPNCKMFSFPTVLSQLWIKFTFPANRLTSVFVESVCRLLWDVRVMLRTYCQKRTLFMALCVCVSVCWFKCSSKVHKFLQSILPNCEMASF